jgi:Arc/MetJ family transcription regulator
VKTNTSPAAVTTEPLPAIDRMMPVRRCTISPVARCWSAAMSLSCSVIRSSSSPSTYPARRGLAGSAPSTAITAYIQTSHRYILDFMAKHLVDIDEQALEMARTELGTTTIKDTVNAALRQATSQREQRVAAALDTLAAAPLEDRIEAWR